MKRYFRLLFVNAKCIHLIETSCFICISGNFNVHMSVKLVIYFFTFIVSVGYIKVIEAMCILPEF